MAFSLADKVMLATLLAVSLPFVIYQIRVSLIPLEILTVFALFIAPPATFFTLNLRGELGWAIVKYSMFAGYLFFAVGCFSLQLAIDNGLVEQGWAFLWMEMVRAASILYGFPLYFGMIRWRVEEEEVEEDEGVEDEEEEERKECTLVLPGGFEVRIRGVEGSLAGVLLGSTEIWRSLVCTWLYVGLVCCTTVVVAAVYDFIGLEAAETLVALLSLASTVSYLHSGYRFFFEDDDLPRSAVVRASLRLFLVIIPAVLGACVWLWRDDLDMIKAIARGTNCFRQPASLYFQQLILPREWRQRWGIGRR